MKRPFQVGERVRVYVVFGNVPFSGSGKVETVDQPENTVWVLLDDGTSSGSILVHHKQCRRLVKRKRRSVWVDKEWLDGKTVSCSVEFKRPTKHLEDYVEFREVAKGNA